jgi:molecular chaperone IbpA
MLRVTTIKPSLNRRNIMTTWKLDHSFSDLAKFDKFFVGADQYFNRIKDLTAATVEVASKYPPYNIKKVSDNKYVIEMAVAGFGKQDIELTLEDNKLVVNGKMETVDDLTKDGIDQTYLWKGISDRAFSRQFTLADNVEIKNANLINGMLKIWLEAIIPESKKPKTIPIDESDESPAPEFLTEKKGK